jgi:hypothetical protein
MKNQFTLILISALQSFIAGVIVTLFLVYGCSVKKDVVVTPKAVEVVITPATNCDYEMTSASIADVTGQNNLFNALYATSNDKFNYRMDVVEFANELGLEYDGTAKGNEKILNAKLTVGILRLLRNRLAEKSIDKSSQHQQNVIVQNDRIAANSAVNKALFVASENSSSSIVVANTVEANNLFNGDGIIASEKAYMDSVNKVINARLKSQQVATVDSSNVHLPAFSKWEKQEHTFDESYAVTMAETQKKGQKIEHKITKERKKLQRKSRRRAALLAFDNFLCKILPGYACLTTNNPTYH